MNRSVQLLGRAPFIDGGYRGSIKLIHSRLDLNTQSYTIALFLVRLYVYLIAAAVSLCLEHILRSNVCSRPKQHVRKGKGYFHWQTLITPPLQRQINEIETVSMDLTSSPLPRVLLHRTQRGPWDAKETICVIRKRM